MFNWNNVTIFPSHLGIVPGVILWIELVSQTIREGFLDPLFQLNHLPKIFGRFQSISIRGWEIEYFWDKMRGTSPLWLALYLYIWFVFCVNLYNQIEFVTLILILLWLSTYWRYTSHSRTCNLKIPYASLFVNT